MIKDKCGTPGQQPFEYLYFRCISWSAIVAGAFIGVGLSFLLSLFSIAIGLSIVTTSKEGLASLAVGGFLGLVISAIASMFVAGTAAGYLGRPCCVQRNLGVLYGFITWCLALILAVLLASQMGRYISSYSNFITNPTAVIQTHDKDMPAMRQLTRNDASVIRVNVQKATNDLGVSSFLMFVIFFVGALASCFGGHFGMTSNVMFCKKPSDTTVTEL